MYTKRREEKTLLWCALLFCSMSVSLFVNRNLSRKMTKYITLSGSFVYTSSKRQNNQTRIFYNRAWAHTSLLKTKRIWLGRSCCCRRTSRHLTHWKKHYVLFSFRSSSSSFFSNFQNKYTLNEYTVINWVHIHVCQNNQSNKAHASVFNHCFFVLLYKIIIVNTSPSVIIVLDDSSCFFTQQLLDIYLLIDFVVFNYRSFMYYHKECLKDKYHYPIAIEL